jgi:cytidylate kinase
LQECEGYMIEEKLLITIDGPGGAGKSTVSKALAAKLDYLYLDTGAYYRAYAYQARQKGILTDNDEQLAEVGRSIRIHTENRGGIFLVFVDGEDVTEKIRTEEISILASTVSARPCVRQALLEIQRKVGSPGGIVAEGRDMGTVVFPEADFKFYLDATTSERAQRRYQELFARNADAAGDYEKVASALLLRDKQDRERDTAPLKPAADAYIIDSTNMTVKDVVDKMVGLILCQRLPK